MGNKMSSMLNRGINICNRLILTAQGYYYFGQAKNFPAVFHLCRLNHLKVLKGKLIHEKQ